MKRKRLLRIFGFVLLAIGILLLLNAFSHITGYFIISEFNKTASSILGLVFLIAGFLLFTEAVEERVNVNA